MNDFENPHEAVKRSRSTVVALSVVCMVAVFSGTAIWVSLWYSTTTVRKADAAETHAVPSIPVQARRPQTRDVPVYLEGLGTVQAFNTVSIKARVDGELQSVLFQEGQEVKKGDLLAVIDPRPFQAALDQAVAKIQQDQANLTNAQYLLSKDQTLEKQNVTTAETVETQQSAVAGFNAQLAEDQAAKESASVSLSYTQIRSPIDGRTGIRLVDVGNQIHTTDTSGIVTVTQTRPISVISTLREDDLGEVRDALKAGPVEVAALSMDQRSVLATGTLSLIDNEIDQTSGTLRIKSTFENSDGALWPGQFIRLRVREKVLRSALTVPSSALQRGPDGYFVYVVGSNGAVAAQKVTAGPIDDGSAVIETGLKGTESVVTAGQYRLEQGTRVSVAAATSSTTAQKD
ncbi:efflux RND transporter periplasmic adaptor subunit [Rhizobium sp. BK376]|uniref:efflux RND transporter periplasmic adaptor subunit n=1 Tax=Rhizobium sp. BK376 TaxID=2512149 RepID=UPI001053DFD7|nr:efflux RND transporter periplasmic adaptor subunit [Rhizobium sp. BK376]TCR71062.1 multidrug efflux system membrane fusion protein [Rhizobium sp. BK376]